jgi:hypothetical protein
LAAMPRVSWSERSVLVRGNGTVWPWSLVYIGFVITGALVDVVSQKYLPDAI